MFDRPEDSLRAMFDAQNFWWPVMAEVQAFSAAGPSVDVKPYLSIAGVDAPVIQSVPVGGMPSGGGWRIDMSLSRGDQVLCIFCGHVVASWFGGRTDGKPMRKADPTDAVAIIGFSKRADRNATASGITLTNALGTLKVELTDTDIAVTALSAVPPTTFSLLTHTHNLDVPHGVTLGPNVGS